MTEASLLNVIVVVSWLSQHQVLDTTQLSRVKNTVIL